MKTVLVPGVAWPEYKPRRHVTKRKFDEFGEVKRSFANSPNTERLLAYLTHTKKRLTRTQLCEALKLTTDQAKYALESLLQQGLIKTVNQRATYRRQTLCHYCTPEN